MDVVTPANTRNALFTDDDPAGQMKHFLLQGSYSCHALFDQFDSLKCNQRVYDDIFDRDTHPCGWVSMILR